MIAIAAFSLATYFRFVLPLPKWSWFDDAYMFLRYAKHWLSGMGFSWNPDEGPVYGITSVSHLLLVTAVRGLTDLPDTFVLISISLLAGLASVACLTIMGFTFFKQLGRYYLPLLVIPSMVLGEAFVYHSKTGMETTLALLFNSVLAAMVFLLAEKRLTKYLILSLIAAYASFITRPDSGLYCLLFPPLLLITDDKRNWKLSLRYVVGFVALLCIDLLFKKAMFGDFLPLPYFSKSSGFYLGYIGTEQWSPVKATLIFLRQSLPYILVIVFCASRMVTSRLIAILLPVFLSFSYYATVNQIMGYQARYYYPALPFLILAAFIAANSYAEKHSVAPHSQFRLSIIRPIIALSLIIILTSPVIEKISVKVWQNKIIEKPKHFKVERKYTTAAAQKLPSIGWYDSMRGIDSLLSHLPSDVILACSEHGYIGSQHPEKTIIDMVGLHDKHIARYGFSVDYLFERKPDIIWLPHKDYTYIRKEIIDNKAFMEKYDFYPDAYEYGLAVIKNSRFSDDINRNLQKEFSRIYSGRLISNYKAEPLDKLDAQ